MATEAPNNSNTMETVVDVGSPSVLKKSSSKISVIMTAIKMTIISLNIDEFLARVEKDQGQMVFFAMSVPDYELMSYNMQELKRYITELKEVVVYYRRVTTADISTEVIGNGAGIVVQKKQ